MKYNKGDILICSTDNLYGQKQQLIIGDKYIINDVIEMRGLRVILDVIHKDTGKRCGLFDERCFIPLDVWREFQLRKVLD
jgi:hypothetical protein